MSIKGKLRISKNTNPIRKIMIIDKIKNLLSNEIGLPFLYESSSVANVKLDRVTEWPISLLLTVTDYQVDNSKNVMRETADISLFFLDRPERNRIDYDATYCQEIINRMKNYALLFISDVNTDKDITFDQSSLNIKAIVDYDDANVVGVCLQCRVREVVGCLI